MKVQLAGHSFVKTCWTSDVAQNSLILDLANKALEQFFGNIESLLCIYCDFSNDIIYLGDIYIYSEIIPTLYSTFSLKSRL